MNSRIWYIAVQLQRPLEEQKALYNAIQSVVDSELTAYKEVLEQLKGDYERLQGRFLATQKERDEARAKVAELEERYAFRGELLKDVDTEAAKMVAQARAEGIESAAKVAERHAECWSEDRQHNRADDADSIAADIRKLLPQREEEGKSRAHDRCAGCGTLRELHSGPLSPRHPFTEPR